jgi:hypothetical protein
LFSAGFDYLRVDLLFGKNGKIYVGELTPTPRAGIGYGSDELHETLGKFWRLDTTKKIVAKT